MSDIDNDNQRCCQTSRSRRCLCLPYDDGFMIAAQILAIVAVLISWVWWVGFIISVITLVMHQIIWCCRQSRLGLVTASVVSIVAALLNIFIGVWFLVTRKNDRWCDAFTMYFDEQDDRIDDRYSYNRSDYCPEKAYATVAFVDAVVWFAVAFCTIAFLKTGRYARWEASLSKTTEKAVETPAALEMGNVEASVEAPVAAATPVAVSEPAEYAPPIAVSQSAEVDV